jgi:ABC-2 type transport system ATP-binding protein
VALVGVSVKRSRTVVLSDVSIMFAQGVTAVVGPNGVGKSTLLRTLVGLQRPFGGRVLVDGVDVFGRGGAILNTYLRRVGWLPQDPGLPSRITARRLVTHAAWLKTIPPEDYAREVDAALELADVAELSDRRLGELSGGQRRRVSLAAALVGGPDVIVVDEPTVGLDPLQRHQFLDRLRALAAQRVVVLATHLLDDVEYGADRWCALGDRGISVDGVVDRATSASLAASVAAALASFSNATVSS